MKDMDNRLLIQIARFCIKHVKLSLSKYREHAAEACPRPRPRPRPRTRPRPRPRPQCNPHTTDTEDYVPNLMN